MVKTAAGPQGNYIVGRAYDVDSDTHKQFTDPGKDEHGKQIEPAALDFAEAAEIAVEERGEKRERDWKPSPQPTEVELPEPKRRAKKRVAKKRG
jgi:hypothetical protein